MAQRMSASLCKQEDLSSNLLQLCKLPGMRAYVFINTGYKRRQKHWDLLAASLTPGSESDPVSREQSEQWQTRTPNVLWLLCALAYMCLYTTHTCTLCVFTHITHTPLHYTHLLYTLIYKRRMLIHSQIHTCQISPDLSHCQVPQALKLIDKEVLVNKRYCI